MKLTGLTLYHFRNYEELHLALHPGVNLLVGENAQGKTNLLEAVFYLSTGGSFRLPVEPAFNICRSSGQNSTVVSTPGSSAADRCFTPPM